MVIGSRVQIGRDQKWEGGGGIRVEPGVFLFFLSVIDDTTKLYQVKSVKIDIFKDEN